MQLQRPHGAFADLQGTASLASQFQDCNPAGQARELSHYWTTSSETGHAPLRIPTARALRANGTAPAGMNHIMVSMFMMIAGGAVVGTLVTTFYAVVTAPLGYQDQTGFHYGVPASERQGDSDARNPVEGDVEGAFALTLDDCFARRQIAVGGTN